MSAEFEARSDQQEKDDLVDASFGLWADRDETGEQYVDRIRDGHGWRRLRSTLQTDEDVESGDVATR